MPTHASINNAGYGKGARVLARSRKRNKVLMYGSTQRGPAPKEKQVNCNAHVATDQVTATRTTFPLYRPSTPRKEIWYDMRDAHQREEGTTRHRRSQQSHNGSENT